MLVSSINCLLRFYFECFIRFSRCSLVGLPICFGYSRILIIVIIRFSPSKWGGGGYLKVHNSVGSLIDWYNVQVRIGFIQVQYTLIV